MNRIGWIFLGAILLVAALFAFTVDMGGRAPAPPAAPPDKVLADAPPGALVLPVVGARFADIGSTWGQARDGGARPHEGTDIMARHGTPVVAAAAGRVDKLFYSKGGGGITAYVRSPDGQWSYYYAHLAAYAPGLHEGQVVRAGEHLGYVGDTGNAGAGNDHLHFGIARMRGGEAWYQGEAVDPYPLLARGRTPR